MIEILETRILGPFSVSSSKSLYGLKHCFTHLFLSKSGYVYLVNVCCAKRAPYCFQCNMSKMKLVISLRALFSEELSQSQWMVTPTFPGLKLIWSSFSLNSISDPSGYSLVLPPEHLQNLPASPYFASQSSPRHRGLSSG